MNSEGKVTRGAAVNHRVSNQLPTFHSLMCLKGVVLYCWTCLTLTCAQSLLNFTCSKPKWLLFCQITLPLHWGMPKDGRLVLCDYLHKDFFFIRIAAGIGLASVAFVLCVYGTWQGREAFVLLFPGFFFLFENFIQQQL